jgi:hypothetical protein
VSTRVLAEGECVMQEGAVAKNMFVIARGSIHLHRGSSTEEGGGRTIGRGHCIGELGVMCAGNGNESSDGVDGGEGDREDGKGVTRGGRQHTKGTHTMRGMHVSTGTAAEEGTVVIVVSSATFCELLTTKPAFRRGVLKVMGAALINVIGGAKQGGGGEGEDWNSSGTNGNEGGNEGETSEDEGGNEDEGVNGSPSRPGAAEHHWRHRLRIQTQPSTHTPPSSPARPLVPLVPLTVPLVPLTGLAGNHTSLDGAHTNDTDAADGATDGADDGADGAGGMSRKALRKARALSWDATYVTTAVCYQYATSILLVCYHHSIYMRHPTHHAQHMLPTEQTLLHSAASLCSLCCFPCSRESERPHTHASLFVHRVRA